MMAAMPKLLMASTRPRPRGRGVLSVGVNKGLPTQLLQRGRARAGAEWLLTFAQKQTNSKLQRGRARAGAE